MSYGFQEFQTSQFAPKDCPLALSCFDVKERVGEGATSEVFRAVDRATGQVVALKVIPRAKIKRGCLAQQIETEKVLLARIDLPGVIRLKGSFEDAAHVYLLFDFASHRDLAKLHKKNGRRLPEDSVKLMVLSLLDTLQALHKLGVVHQDLKPANILIDEACGLKLSDFGSAAVKPTASNQQLYEAYLTVNPEPVQKESFATHETTDETCLSPSLKLSSSCGQNTSLQQGGSQIISWHQAIRSEPLVGTWEFLSPEAVTDNEPHSSSDLWALGVLTQVLITGKYPVTGATNDECLQKIIEGKFDFDEHLSKNARNFVESLLKKDRSDRLGCRRPTLEENYAEIRAHPFLKASQSKTSSQAPHQVLLAKARTKRWLVLSQEILLRLGETSLETYSLDRTPLGSIPLTEVVRVEGLKSGVLRVVTTGGTREFQLVDSPPKLWVVEIAGRIGAKPD